MLDFARQLEPFLARPRAQVAERADGVLARSLRGADGLHQHIVGVRPALVGPRRPADVHVALQITEALIRQPQSSLLLVTILAQRRTRQRPPKQYQGLRQAKLSDRSKITAKK